MRAGTGESGTDLEQIRELEERLDNFRIEVQDDITIRGSAWQGYALNVTSCPEVTIVPVTPTGACCVDTDCTIETESDCEDMGGTYQGDGTPCSPNPCCTPISIQVGLHGTYRCEGCDTQIEISGSTCVNFTPDDCTLPFTYTNTLTVSGSTECVTLPGLVHVDYGDTVVDVSFTANLDGTWDFHADYAAGTLSCCSVFTDLDLVGQTGNVNVDEFHTVADGCDMSPTIEVFARIHVHGPYDC
jgi:hypothetical protein